MPDIFDRISEKTTSKTGDIFDRISAKTSPQEGADEVAIAGTEQPSRVRSLLSAFPKGAILGSQHINPLAPSAPIPYEMGQRIVNQFLPTQEKEPEKLLERAGKLAPVAALGPEGLIQKALQVAGGTVGGHLAEEAGGGQLAQLLSEIGSMGLTGALTRSIPRALAYARRGVKGGTEVLPATREALGYQKPEPPTIDITEGAVKYPFESEHEMGQKIQELVPALRQSPSLQARTQQVTSPELAIDKYLSPEKKRLYNLAPISQTLSIRPTAPPIAEGGPHISQIVGNEVSPVEFHSPVQGGEGLKNEVNQMAALKWEDVNNVYEVSKEINKGYSGIRPSLISEYEDVISEIDRIPSPSAIQEVIRSTAKDVIKRIYKPAKVNKKGEEIEPFEYLDISNQDLIEQIQSINQKRSFEYEQAVPEGAFSRLTDPLYRSLEDAFPEGSEANKMARDAYRKFAEIFDNPKIRPFRSRVKEDYPTLYRDAQNYQTYSLLKEILAESKRGKEFLGALERDLVKNRMQPFFKNPEKIGSVEYEEAIRELIDTIGKEVADKVDKKMRQFIPRQRYKRISGIPHKILREKPKRVVQKLGGGGSLPRELAAKKPSELSEIISGKTKEQIAQVANTIEGLDKLEKAMLAQKGGKELFEDVKAFKALDVLHNGRISPLEKSKSIQDLLKDREKIAYLTRLIGVEKVNKLREISKNLENLEDLLELASKSKFDISNIKDLGSIAKELVNVFTAHNIGKKVISRLLYSKNLDRISDLSKKLSNISVKDLDKSQIEALIRKIKDDLSDLERL